MEEHLRAEESLVADIDVDHVAVDCLMHKVLELGRLRETASLIRDLLVVLLVLFKDILADVAVLFLDLAGNLGGVFGLELFTSVLKHLQSELSDVPAGERDALHAAADDVAVTYWEHVGDAIACIDDRACQVTGFHLVNLGIGASKLSEQCKCRLDTDEKALDVKCLEHNLCDLLTVFGRVHRGFGQDEPVLLWLAPEVGVDRFVPVALDALPV